jgi:sulfur-oxidizing protein SoxX
MRKSIAIAIIAAGAFLVSPFDPRADEARHKTTPPDLHHRVGPTGTSGSRAPIRITDEELHRSGGVPKGWRFSLPDGDQRKGRHLFVELECYVCHTVRGESFPGETIDVGPDLTGMGAHHPAEYLAESIINPNAVIVMEEGYTGPDGLSRMPSYADILSLQDLLDLVAYLKSLTAKAPSAEPLFDH